MTILNSYTGRLYWRTIPVRYNGIQNRCVRLITDLAFKIVSSFGGILITNYP